MEERKTNGLAIASFVLSLCGIFTFGVTTFVGWILGMVAYSQIKRNNENGEGFAIVSIVLGSILLAIGFFIMVVTPSI